MSKCIKYIFSKICIFQTYFLYKSEIYSPKFIWHILDIYFNDAKVYFRGQKFYMLNIFFISMGDANERQFFERYQMATVGLEGWQISEKFSIHSNYFFLTPRTNRIQKCFLILMKFCFFDTDTVTKISLILSYIIIFYHFRNCIPGGVICIFNRTQ